MRKMRNRRACAGIFMWILTISLVLPVWAKDEVVFDDYVNSAGGASGSVSAESTASANSSGEAPDNYNQEESAGMTDTVVDANAGSSYSEDQVYAENNDGDDTYISNNGTVFQIPRPKDTSARVYDYAGLFTDEEIRKLEEEISKLDEKKDADILILTSNDVPLDAYYSTETSMRYARQFLVDNGFKDDSFICIIDMNNRVFWACGYGKYGDKKYSGWGQKVYELVRQKMSDKNYYDAMQIYLKEINRLDNVLLALIPTPLSLIISAALAFLVILIFVIRHGTSQPSKATTPPVEALSYQRIRHNKTHLGTTVHRRHIDRSSHSGGGGGGGGFSGGGFSSGSGGSHSGGGGHF